MHLYFVGALYSALVFLPVLLLAFAAHECCKGEVDGRV